MTVKERKQILEMKRDGYSGLEIAIAMDMELKDVSAALQKFGHFAKTLPLSMPDRQEAIRLKSTGLDAKQVAYTMHVSESAVVDAFAKDRGKIKMVGKAHDMLEKYKTGESLESIARIYGLTRERVRQLVRKQFGAELGYGPMEQKYRKEELDRQYRSLIVIDARIERREEETIEKFNEAKRRGIEPEYFNSVSQFSTATGIAVDAVKEFLPSAYRVLEKNKQRWSTYYDACRMCGTTTVKHATYGYCKNCRPKSPEFKEAQKRSYQKHYDERIAKQKEFEADYYNRPEVIAKLEREYDEKYFGGNRKKVLERDNFQCRGCGMSTNDKDTLGRAKARVWHLKEKDDNSLESLGTYCQSCLYKYLGLSPRNGFGRRH